MQNPTLIAIIAGVVSALLFVPATTGSLLALPLFYLTALPLFLVGLGWGAINAAIAGLVASVVVTLLLGGLGGLGFLVTFAVPAALLTHLALLWRQPEAQAQREWFPPGKIVIWIAVMAGALTALAVPLLGFDAESYRANLQQIMEQSLLKDLEGAAPEGFDPEQMKQFIAFLTTALPAISAMIWMLAMVFNLWGAGRIIDRAGRALRPWPDIGAMTYPREMPIGFVASLIGTLLPGILGIIAIGFAGAFVTAYILLGLVVIHVLSRLSPFRIFILFSVYVGLIFFGWIALIVATIGMAEPIFNLRDRFSATPPPRTPDAE